MEYHKTKDTLHVMRLPGHKNINNTLIYIQLVSFSDDDYLARAAKDARNCANSWKQDSSTSPTWTESKSSENGSDRQKVRGVGFEPTNLYRIGASGLRL